MSGRVAVVGGTGFLGSHVVLELLKSGYTPVVVARTPKKVARVLPDIDVEVRQGEVTDLDGLRSALGGCEAVHSAASLVSQVFVSPSREMREAAIRTNVEGTLNVLRAARESGAGRVVVTSSSSTRYQPRGALANEESPPTHPRLVRDAYVESKLREEAAVAAYVRQTGLEVVTILPGGMVGPRDVGPSLLGGALLARLNGLREGRATLDGGIPVVDVRDVARAHIAALERGTAGRSYLVVARTVPAREWQRMLGRFTGLPEPRFIPPAMAMSFAWWTEFLARVKGITPRFNRDMVRHVIIRQQYDCSRVQRELGVTFTPVEVSLRDTILWYVENGWVHQPERLALVAERPSMTGLAQGTGTEWDRFSKT